MNRKVFNYLDNQMSSDELLEFEAEIQLSPDLQKMIKDYRTTLGKIRELDVKPDMNDYFIQTRVKFRSRLENTRYSLFPKWTLIGQTVLATLFVMLMYIGLSESELQKNQLINKTLSTLTPEELHDIAQTIQQAPSEIENIVPDDLDENQPIHEAISKEIGINPKNVHEIAQDINLSTDDLINTLSSKEADELYTSISNNVSPNR